MVRAGGKEFRFSVDFPYAVADCSPLVDDTGPFFFVDILSVWFDAAASSVDHALNALVKVGIVWSGSVGASALVPWGGAGSSLRKMPQVSFKQFFEFHFPLLALYGLHRATLASISQRPGFNVSIILTHSQCSVDLFSYAGILHWCLCPVRAFGFQGRSHAPRPFLGTLLPLESDPCLSVASRPGSVCKAFGPQPVLGFGENKSKLFHKNLEQERPQILIKMLTGKTICRKIGTGTLIKKVKEEIQVVTGIPTNLLCLIHAGKILQENLTIQHYGIGRDSTIIISTRLRGGSSGAGPKGFQGSTSKTTGSYRDATKGKDPSMGKEPAASNTPPGQYIVDQSPENPSISLDIPEVKCIYSDLENKAVICRFNGFWPKTEALYRWIHTVWTQECQIHLCAKGFFIVTFLETEERDNILNEGPWFWGSAGLFVTPWFSGFDANTMVVSRMPVWVRLHNLPLHFWHFKSLTAIGNSLGRMLKIDTDRHLKGIFTFARICVEVDLSKGLPESIFLTFNNIQWKQSLDYENTAFRCRGCQQTGHLLKACPSKSKPQQRKSRGWQNLNEVLERRTAKKKTPPVTEEEETEAEEDDTTLEEVEIENQKEDTTANKDSLPHTNQVETQQDKAELTNVDQTMGGNKRQHQSDNSDSDKESGKLKESSQLVIVSTEPTLGEWRKVEKKKGRKT